MVCIERRSLVGVLIIIMMLPFNQKKLHNYSTIMYMCVYIIGGTIFGVQLIEATIQTTLDNDNKTMHRA